MLPFQSHLTSPTELLTTRLCPPKSPTSRFDDHFALEQAIAPQRNLPREYNREGIMDVNRHERATAEMVIEIVRLHSRVNGLLAKCEGLPGLEKLTKTPHGTSIQNTACAASSSIIPRPIKPGKEGTRERRSGCKRGTRSPREECGGIG